MSTVNVYKTMYSASDYIAVKMRRAAIQTNPESRSSEYTTNKQYLLLQTTFQINEDNEPVQIPSRFGILLPESDLARQQFRDLNNQPVLNIWSVPAIPIKYRKHIGPPIAPKRFALFQ